MKSENQRLRGLLDEATNNYNVLQMHISNFMKEHKTKLDAEEHQVLFDVKYEEKKESENERAMVATRQFMDLGLATKLETNEPFTSIDRLGSPANNVEVISNELVNAHKIPRLSPPINVEQAEATMRKARVAVRALSESPMVSQKNVLLRLYNF